MKKAKSTFERVMSDPKQKKAFEKEYVNFLLSEFPAPLIRFLRDTYKPENVVIKDDDDSVPVEESEWFNSLDTTPAEMIVANRDLRNWSQVMLAEKLGIPVQNLCAMENGRRVVSRKMAVKLGEIFGTDPAAFFDFGKK